MKARLVLGCAVLLALAILALVQVILATPPAARAGGETFTVNSDGDASDAADDCVCDTAGPDVVCTLRAAIEAASDCSGPQTIDFSAPWHITPTTALPPIIGDETVIDGSEEWTTAGACEIPGVVLNGDGGAFNGLVLSGTHQSAIYGLQIIRFGWNGVYLCDGSTENQIGGTGSHQRNVISRNGANGVRISEIASQRNVVKGNYVGTNPSGVAGWWDGVLDWGNSQHGVSVWDGADNEIRENLIADNGWSGATMDNLSYGQIVLNHIGMDVNGDPLGNAYYGVHLGNGGHAELYGNEIAFNSRGVHLQGASGATLLPNTIYSNTASLRAPPHGGGIYLTGTGTHATVRFSHVLSNTAHYGGGIAVENGATLELTDSTIRGNRAQADVVTPVGGGGIYVYQGSASIRDNAFLTNVVSGTCNARGGAVYVDDPSGVMNVVGNDIIGNEVAADAGGGAGIYRGGGAAVQILDNKIVGNTAELTSPGGSAIHIGNDPGSALDTLAGNWIAYNSGPHVAAVHLSNSGHALMYNNVIVRNNYAGLEFLDSVTDLTVVNNTIAYNIGHGIIMQNSSVDIQNNILAFNSDFGLFSGGSCLYLLIRNDVYGNTLGPDNVFLPWYMKQDPVFSDASADRFSLVPGSPCVDQGDPSVAPPISYNGVPRPQGAGPDIGAYEVGVTYIPLVMRNY